MYGWYMVDLPFRSYPCSMLNVGIGKIPIDEISLLKPWVSELVKTKNRSPICSHTTFHYNIGWCMHIHLCDVVQYDMIWYDMIWYDMIWYDIHVMICSIYIIHSHKQNNVVQKIEEPDMLKHQFSHGFYLDDNINVALANVKVPFRSSRSTCSS